jgi:hypothetical protein
VITEEILADLWALVEIIIEDRDYFSNNPSKKAFVSEFACADVRLHGSTLAFICPYCTALFDRTEPEWFYETKGESCARITLLYLEID